MGTNVPGRFAALEVSETGAAGSYVIVRGIKSLNTSSVTEEYTATDHDSEAEEYQQGLSSKMMSGELNAEADDPGQIMLENAHEETRQLYYRYRRQYGPGHKLWSGRINVNKFDDSRPKELASISFELRISGKPAVSVQT